MSFSHWLVDEKTFSHWLVDEKREVWRNPFNNREMMIDGINQLPAMILGWDRTTPSVPWSWRWSLKTKIWSLTHLGFSENVKKNPWRETPIFLAISSGDSPADRWFSWLSLVWQQAQKVPLAIGHVWSTPIGFAIKTSGTFRSTTGWPMGCPLKD